MKPLMGVLACFLALHGSKSSLLDENRPLSDIEILVGK